MLLAYRPNKKVVPADNQSKCEVCDLFDSVSETTF